MDTPQPALLFVYNADSGLLNLLKDWAHKVFSPDTYPCQLCGLTYSNTGMEAEWKQFVTELPMAAEFIYRDELESRGLGAIDVPAILFHDGATSTSLVDADAINQCETLAQLKELVTRSVASLPQAATAH